MLDLIFTDFCGQHVEMTISLSAQPLKWIHA